MTKDVAFVSASGEGLLMDLYYPAEGRRQEAEGLRQNAERLPLNRGQVEEVVGALIGPRQIQAVRQWSLSER